MPSVPSYSHPWDAYNSRSAAFFGQFVALEASTLAIDAGRDAQPSKSSRTDPIPALGKGRPSVLPPRLPHVLWGHYLLHPEYGKVAP